MQWIHLGEEGRRIQQILADIDREDTLAALRAWEQYLAEKLVFPFDAVVSEYQESGYLQAGDTISVRRLREVHELYGLLVELRRRRESYDFPLCDLEVSHRNPPTTSRSKTTVSGLPTSERNRGHTQGRGDIGMPQPILNLTDI